MDQADLERLWRDDAHWGRSRLGLYFCKDDPRLFVPKRPPRMGWTLNMAHAAAGWVLVGVIVLPLLIVGVAAGAGGG